MTSLFISDIHLSEDNTELQERFTHFIQNQAIKADKLYILGDLFDYWVNDKIDNKWQNKVFEQLQIASKKTSLFFMPGNRDFLLGENLLNHYGISLLPDPYIINLDGKKTILTHGDHLCSLDRKFQIYRKFSRINLVKTLFKSLPAKFRNKFADNFRKRSIRHKQHSSENIMDVFEPTLEKMLRDHQCQDIIHGHTHRLAHHKHNQINRYVLGDWHQQGNMLQCQKDQPWDFKYF